MPGDGAPTNEKLPRAVVRRRPKIEFHEQVRAGEKNKLVVSLSDMLSGVSARKQIQVLIARGKKQVTLTVTLSAPGFTVSPRQELPLTVGREFNAERERVVFTLTALEPADGKPVTRDIRADIWNGRACIGGVTHWTKVVPKSYRRSVSGEGNSREVAFDLRSPGKTCDLVILVQSIRDSGTAPFQLSLKGTEANGAPYESRRVGVLKFPPTALSRELHQEFAQFKDSFPEGKGKAEVRRWQAQLLDKLEAMGKRLWSRLPEDFRREYLALYRSRSRRPDSILIHSDEVIVPWELIVPFENGKIYPKLGVSHVIGRWRPALGQRPRPQQVQVGEVALMTPRDASLPWAVVEVANLTQLSKAFRTPQRVDRQSFKRLLKRTDIRLVHFSGHGIYARNADLSTLQLEHSDTIAPSDFLGSPLLAKAQPIIYLNACEVGASGVVMGQMGGFSVQCVENGCGGIIAPYWAVADDSAAAFSLAFYQKLISGRSIGEALRQLRAENPKDPTFQAFGFMGDPWARAKFV